MLSARLVCELPIIYPDKMAFNFAKSGSRWRPGYPDEIENIVSSVAHDQVAISR